MQPTRGDVHVNRPLTNISVAFMQDAANFVADQVFPNVPVQKQSDRYFTYDRGEMNRDEMELRAPGTESAGRGYTVDSTPTYYAPVYAYHHDIPDEIRANADAPLDLDRETTYIVTLKALIKREVLWATKYFQGGVWTNDYDGGGATGQVPHWNISSSTPVENVRAAATTQAESTGFRPNTLVMGRRVFDSLVDHPEIIDRIKYSSSPGSPAIVNKNTLAQLFEVERVLVMDSIRNTAKKGLANSHSFIGGKHALLCYVAPNPGIMTPSAGYTFSWAGWFGASQSGTRIKTIRLDREDSDRVEIQMALDQKVVAADMGTFWENIVD